MPGTRPTFSTAPATEPAFADAALVLCAHGIRGGVGVAAEHADQIRRRGRIREVHACGHKGKPGLAATLAAVEAPTIVFAPLLMAEAYTLRAMLEKLERVAPPGREVRVCRPVGAHPELASLMAARARYALAERGWQLERTALLVVGHGTERHAHSSASAREHARRIAAAHPFREVAVAFLDEAPTVPEALARLDARHIVAEGLFVDRGEHGEEDIPRLLARDDRAGVYTGPVGSAPEIVKLILEQMATARRLARAA